MQAFVGYRDYGDVQRFEIMDFVEKEGFPGLQRFLDHIVAKGGDDSTEDIAGGLKVRGAEEGRAPGEPMLMLPFNALCQRSVGHLSNPFWLHEASFSCSQILTRPHVTCNAAARGMKECS